MGGHPLQHSSYPEPPGAITWVAVRDRIEAEPQWVLILDNADNLALFGVSRKEDQLKSLLQYIPGGPGGTHLVDQPRQTHCGNACRSGPRHSGQPDDVMFRLQAALSCLQ